MTIWYLHQYFRTPAQGGALRSYHLAHKLVTEGHVVHMVTAHNSPNYLVEDIEGILVHYLPVPYDQSMGIVARARSFRDFVDHVLAWVASEPQADFIYATSTPLSVGYLAYALHKKYDIPYVFEVRDLWPDVPLQMAPKLRLLGPWLRKWEKRIYRHAQGVVALSPPMADTVVARSKDKAIITIPNFADTQVFRPAPKSEAWQRRWHVPEGHLVVAYTGSVGQANAPDTIIKWLDAVAKSKLPITFLVAGEGSEWHRLETEAVKRGWTHVQLLRYRNQAEIAEMLSGADLALVTFKENVPVLGTNSPNKLFDALAAGCGVITNRQGWYTDLLTDRGAGLQLDEQNLVPFLNYVLVDNEELDRMQAAARALAQSTYSKEALVDRWYAFLQERGLH